MIYVPHVIVDPMKVNEELERIKRSEMTREDLEKALAISNVHSEAKEVELRRIVERQRLIDSSFRDKMETVLGFPFVMVGPGSMAWVMTQPQISFRPTRLAVDPECAPFFLIEDFRIGNVSGLPNEWGIPATLFPPIEGKDDEETKRIKDQLRLSFGTVSVCQNASLFVMNRSTEAREFKGAYWGYGLDP